MTTPATLLTLHRRRLQHIVESRLDPRLAARLDASDVVQEALIDATAQLDDYLRDLPRPFYAWLRQFAWERMIKLHERHITAQKRTVRQCARWIFPDKSGLFLADRLAASASSPGEGLSMDEQRDQIQSALADLRPHDREILVLLYLEGMR